MCSEEKIDQTFEGCDGVTGIADNIVVFGKSYEEHELTDICMKTGLKLNPDKCKIRIGTWNTVRSCENLRGEEVGTRD